MTENSRIVFEFLKKNYGKELTKHEISEKTGVSIGAINGSILGLVRKGMATDRTETIVSKYGDQKLSVVHWITLTEKGMEFDPEEEERRKELQRLEEKAARKAARKKEREERARQNFIN